MAPKFNPIIRRTRLVAGDVSAETMLLVATDLRNAVRSRIQQAKDVRDNNAPPLAQSLRPVWKILKRGNLAGVVIYQRILHQKHVNALTYPHYKQAAGKKPIRDWDFTGRTLRSMQVLSAGPNKAVIGFDDSGPRGPKQASPSVIAAANNRRWPQFGASPKDLEVATASLLSHLQPMKVVTVSAA